MNGVKNGEGSEKFKNGDSYEGSYYDGKFHGMGILYIIKVCISGEISQDTKASSSKAQEMATEYGSPTIRTKTATDMRANTETTEKMALEFTNGKMAQFTKENSSMISSTAKE